MSIIPRRKVLITGAAGGMGRACARLFGASDDLILTDVVAEPLEKFSQELVADCYNVVWQAGDLANDVLLAELTDAIDAERPLALVHTAGLSPSMSDWRTIMQVNLVATEKLLRAVEPKLAPGSAVVLIASSAGHMMPALPDVDAVLADPLAPDFFERIEQVINSMGGEKATGGMAGISYSLSKRAVHTICRQRGVEWGPKGTRVTSISPGIILTPMGRSAIAHGSGAQMLLDSTPVGRAGTPMDIALAAQFLTSDAASFISALIFWSMAEAPLE